MKNYCKSCQLYVETKEGYYYDKCVHCDSPVKKENFNKIKLTAVLCFIATILLLSLSLSSAYNAVVNVSTTNLGNIRSDFYGIAQPYELATLYNISKDVNSCTRNETTNTTLTRSVFNNANFKNMRLDGGFEDMNESFYLQNSTITNTNRELIPYAYNNNLTYTLITNNMPNWLANKTGGFCTNTGTNSSCPPTNYTKWGELVIAMLNEYTLNGRYASAIQIEVWNEPWAGSWCNNLSTDNILKSVEYNKLYNATYLAIKSNPNYTNVKVIGLGGSDASNIAGTNVNISKTNITYNWFSNFSNQADGYSLHYYYGTGTGSQSAVNITYAINEYKNLCNRFGNTYCNNVYITELNTYRTDIPFTSNQTLFTSVSLEELLNQNVSQVNLFKFASPFRNATCDSTYNYTMYTQWNNALLQNYNITKTYSDNHKAGNTVYNSSSSNSSLKVVTSKDGSKTYITLTNTLSEATNVTLNTGLVNSNSYLRNVETNTVYPLGADGIATISNLGGYGVLTLDSNPNAVSINPFASNPANGSTVNTRYVNLGWNITSVNPLSSIIFNWNNTNYSLYDDSLVLYYNFDNRSSLGENDTLVKDISRWGNNGSVIGKENISNTINSIFNNGYNFTGKIAYINISDRDSFSPWVSANKTTISLWFNPTLNFPGTGSDGHVVLMAKGFTNNFEWELSISNRTKLNDTYFKMYTLDGSGSAQTTNIGSLNSRYNFNSWNNVIVVLNGSNANLWLNGIMTATVSISKLNGNGNASITIGTRDVTGTGFFNGSMDDVRIWNRSLSDSEVIKLYKSQITKYDNTNYSLNINNSIIGINNNNIFINVNDTSSNNNLSYLTLRYLGNLAFTGTQTSTVPSDFYGVNTHGMYLSNLTYLINYSNNLFTLSNFSWHREKFLSSKMTAIRIDSYLHNVANADGTFNEVSYSDSNNTIRASELIAWAYQNNITVTVILGYMPKWLANVTNECWNNNVTCLPNNYTTWGNITLGYINNITNQGAYISTIKVEVWNEPDLATFLLSNLTQNSSDVIIRANGYLKLYNATKIRLNQVYPNLEVLAPSFAADNDRGITMMNYFLSNFSVNSFSTHRYEEAGEELLTVVSNRINQVIANCTYYGDSCDIIELNEWNTLNSTLQNNSNYTMLYSSKLGSVYAYLLNKNASRYRSKLYQWSEQTWYNNTLYYYQYPIRFSMLSEPQLDNSLYASYSITANFTRYATGNIYNSTSINPLIYTVSSKINSACSQTIVSSENDIGNYTVSFDTTLCGSQLIDTSNGNLISNGSTVVLDAYGIKYLTVPSLSYENGVWYWDNYLGENIRPATAAEAQLYASSNPVSAVNDNGFARTVLNILLGIFSLAIVGVALLFLKYYYDEGELTPEKIVTIVVGLILGIAFVRILADVVNRL